MSFAPRLHPGHGERDPLELAREIERDVDVLARLAGHEAAAALCSTLAYQHHQRDARRGIGGRR